MPCSVYDCSVKKKKKKKKKKKCFKPKKLIIFIKTFVWNRV